MLRAVVLILVIVGTVLELAGICLAAREVKDRRRELANYEARSVSLYASGLIRAEGTATATETGGDPPTLEQRVVALEGQLAALPATIRASAEQARTDSEQAARMMLNDVRRSLQDDVDGVRAFLLRVTAPTREVWASLGLLVVGLLLQCAANVVGAWPHH